MPEPLTDRQAELLSFVLSWTQLRGMPPTVTEMATAMRVSSTNTINDHVKALRRKGYLMPSESKRIARQIRPTELGADPRRWGRTVAVPLYDTNKE